LSAIVGGDRQGTEVHQSDEPVGKRHRHNERRARTRHFHFPERRTGFDRRRRYPVTGTLRRSPLILLAVLVAVNVLSALDFAFTYLQLQAGVASEGNPVLAAMFAQNAGSAWLFKTLVVLAVTLGIWHQRKHRKVLAVSIVALVTYFLVIGYHVYGMRATGLL